MAEASTGGSTGSRTAGSSTAAESNGTGGGGATEAATIVMTPEAALARHIEWLDFALDAATAEEGWRRERLAKASKGNRAKRTDRLAEVTAEIQELTALLAGIRALQARASGVGPAVTTPRRRGRPPGSRNKPKPATATTPPVAAATPSVATANSAPLNGADPSATTAAGRAPSRPRGRRPTATPTAG